MQRSFEEVCGPYSGLVYRHCLQLLRNPQEAEDAAQETMLKAFRSFDRFNGKAPGGWLYRIAHNLCLDRLSCARARHEAPLPPEMPEKADPSPNPEEAALAAQKRQKLGEILATLPLRQQTLLALFYGEGMSCEEIAAREGLPLGTVKSGLSRARETLKKRLPGDLFP